MSQNYVKVARVKVVNNFGKFYDIINKNLNDKPTKSLAFAYLLKISLLQFLIEKGKFNDPCISESAARF